MDENPYKAPDEQGSKSPAKRSDFLDPVKNLAGLLVIATVLTLGFIAQRRHAELAETVRAESEKARAAAERENAGIKAP